jgi:5-(carboxyamino)imidazole ribonucleotide mutase
MASKNAKAIQKPVVGIIMGSQSDWETMQNAANVLAEFDIPYEAKVMSAHRTLPRVTAYGSSAISRGLKVVIAGAGGAAHLPGVLAALTTLPVLGVPVASKLMNGLDSLLSIAQMPGGIPVGTLAVGNAGAKNAGLLAIAILAVSDKKLAAKLIKWRETQAAKIVEEPVTEQSSAPRHK